MALAVKTAIFRGVMLCSVIEIVLMFQRILLTPLSG